VRSEVSISGAREDRIAAVAAHQRGRIARRQLLAVGVSHSTIVWLVDKGRLLPSLRGVFCVGHSAPTELGSETEALLSVRDGAALCHWSATAVLGLWTPAPREVEVVLDTYAGGSNPGVHVHRSRILEPRDIWIRKGLPVTSPARTLLDLAATATDRRLEVVFDRGITERIVSLAHVRDVLDRAGGHPGRGRLADLVGRENGASAMTASEAAERMLALIKAAGLPMPEVEFPFGPYELDFYWPAARFVVEVDGYRWHSSRYRFERDRRKDNDLRRADIEVMRVVRREIIERSHGVIADVARSLARRGL